MTATWPAPTTSCGATACGTSSCYGWSASTPPRHHQQPLDPAFTGRHELDAANTLSGNLYWRNIRTGTINGDVSDSLDRALYH
jgi:hypothetical protein